MTPHDEWTEEKLKFLLLLCTYWDLSGDKRLLGKIWKLIFPETKLKHGALWAQFNQRFKKNGSNLWHNVDRPNKDKQHEYTPEELAEFRRILKAIPEALHTSLADNLKLLKRENPPHYVHPESWPEQKAAKLRRVKGTSGKDAANHKHAESSDDHQAVQTSNMTSDGERNSRDETSKERLDDSPMRQQSEIDGQNAENERTLAEDRGRPRWRSEKESSTSMMDQSTSKNLQLTSSPVITGNNNRASSGPTLTSILTAFGVGHRMDEYVLRDHPGTEGRNDDRVVRPGIRLEAEDVTDAHHPHQKE
ncbi:hypothetical protein Slin14017_G067940 [Septoria linicola]|nr:hypothetical protein Slin14017_G067940 [Septoria linicola]